MIKSILDAWKKNPSLGFLTALLIGFGGIAGALTYKDKQVNRLQELRIQCERESRIEMIDRLNKVLLDYQLEIQEIKTTKRLNDSILMENVKLMNRIKVRL